MLVVSSYSLSALSDLPNQELTPAGPAVVLPKTAAAVQHEAPPSATAGFEPMTNARVLVVGEYLIGDAEDTLLNGHPDIRY